MTHSNQKHTPEPSWTEEHFRKLFEMGDSGEERLKAMRQYAERSKICMQAMQGIDDPEAFMLDVRALLGCGDNMPAREALVRKHLKGGE